MFELLNTQDKENITSWIKAYGPHNYNRQAGKEPVSSMASLDYILRHWDKNKEKLQPIFGNNLILRRSFKYDIPLESKVKELSSKLCGVASYDSLKYHLMQAIDSVPELYAMRWELMGLLGTYALSTNTCEGVCYEITRNDDGYFSIYLPNDKVYRVDKNMRPLRVVRKILETWGKEDWKESFEDTRIIISQVNNSTSHNGELCLSIHPLDYMTMSDNENNWGSCMRWRNNGEYSQGTIEMMNSPTVIVAYLHNSNHSMTLPNGENWNNKIWRELFVVTDNIITEVKSYPYNDPYLSQYCYEWIKQIASEAYDSNYEDYDGFDGSSLCISDRDVSVEFDNGYMYNDFGCMNRNHIIGIDMDKILETYPRITTDRFPHITVPYSGPSECVWCGRDIDYGYDSYDDNEEPGAMRICIECASATICSCCGRAIYDGDNMYYTADGEIVCQDCYDEHYITDPISGEIYSDHVANTLYLATGITDDGEPDYTGDIIYLSDSTWNRVEELTYYFVTTSFRTHEHENIAGPFHWNNTRTYVLASDCTKAGLALFDFYEPEFYDNAPEWRPNCEPETLYF